MERRQRGTVRIRRWDNIKLSLQGTLREDVNWVQDNVQRRIFVNTGLNSQAPLHAGSNLIRSTKALLIEVS
jgi:hypothetical protein